MLPTTAGYPIPNKEIYVTTAEIDKAQFKLIGSNSVKKSFYSICFTNFFILF